MWCFNPPKKISFFFLNRMLFNEHYVKLYPQDTHDHQHIEEYHKNGTLKDPCATLLVKWKDGTFTKKFLDQVLDHTDSVKILLEVIMIINRI